MNNDQLLSSDQLLNLVGEIYEASLNPSHWNHVLAMMCQQLEMKSGALLVHDLETSNYSVAGSYKIASITKHSYSLGLGKLDIGWKASVSEPEGTAFQFASHEETKREHPFYYNMMMRPLNVHYMAGVNVYNNSEWIVALGLHRSLEQGAFDAATLSTLEILTPHFARAMRIQKEFHRLRVENYQLNNVLSRVMMGVVIVNEQRELVYCNPVAEQVLTSNPTLKVRGRALSAYSNAETAALNQAIDELMFEPRSVSKSLGLSHPEKASPLAVTLTNTGANEALENLILPAKAVTLYLTDPNMAMHIRHESLMETYQLTQAEAKVAIMVANGMALKDIAEHNQVSVLTVRTQLRHVFDKMGVNRQQDIVKLLLSGALNPISTVSQGSSRDLGVSDI